MSISDVVLRGVRNSVFAAVLVAGCGRFSHDFAPYRSHSFDSASRPTIHYVFSPSDEVGKAYIGVMRMWKEVFGSSVRIRPYCTPLYENGLIDTLYCERSVEAALNDVGRITGDDVKLPLVMVEHPDGRTFRAGSDSELCTLLGRPSDCLDDFRDNLYSGSGSRSSRRLMDGPASHTFRY